MINIRDDVWIKGFDDNQTAFTAFEELVKHPNGTIYAGKTIDIPNEIAENVAYKGELCEYYWNEILDDYDKTITANESIQLALAKEEGRFYEYCIIYKK